MTGRFTCRHACAVAVATALTLAPWSASSVAGQDPAKWKNGHVLVSVALPASTASVCVSVQGQAPPGGCIALPPSDVTLSVQVAGSTNSAALVASASVTPCTDGARITLIANTEGWARVQISAQGTLVHDTGNIPLAQDNDVTINRCRGTT